ncbi:MAG TPA: hypothetical protein VGH11_00240 [Jatrophihabitans sp.]|jgi:hypothetical protein
MTGLALHRRVTRLTVAALLAVGLAAAPAVTTLGTAPAEAAGDQVGLVIQDGASSKPAFQCVSLTPNMTGNDVLKAADHTLTFDKSNFLTAIDSVPAKVAAFDSKHPRYWSYWQQPANGKWAYSNSGSDKTHPKAGTVEGWFYFDGATYAPAPVTFAQVCPATASATAVTNPPSQAKAATKKSSSAGPIAGTVVAVVVLGALAALMVARSRRVRNH